MDESHFLSSEDWRTRREADEVKIPPFPANAAEYPGWATTVSANVVSAALDEDAAHWVGKCLRENGSNQPFCQPDFVHRVSLWFFLAGGGFITDCPPKRHPHQENRVSSWVLPNIPVAMQRHVRDKKHQRQQCDIFVKDPCG